MRAIVLVCLLAVAEAHCCVRLFAYLVAATRACARAGKLVWGALNTNACPAGSSVITDAAQCQAAAATAGKGWSGSGSWPDAPRGCAWYTGGTVFLNTHPTGAADPDRQPLCAVAATGPC